VPTNTVSVSPSPLVAHYVAELRDERTDQHRFVALATQLASMLGYEAFADLAAVSAPVTTPVARDDQAKKIADEVVLVPILRAGLSLVPALQNLLPSTRLCCVGLRRNEVTLQPDIYLDGLPEDLSGCVVAILDPMLATGGSLNATIAMAKERGAHDIRAICLIAAVPGVKSVAKEHPDVRIFVAALDEVLNEHGYIVPGLGDAGDRLFGQPVR
jgi:uracil phosphoribosyltransferase